MKAILGSFMSLVFFCCALSTASAADTAEKVVYHINDSTNATAILKNVNNHLDASPNAQIVVVSHGPGIDFMLEGAQDKNGNPYEPMVQGLVARHVVFKVCNNTLNSRKIDKSKVLAEAIIVPSGVAEIARLQWQEHYAYMKP